MRKNTANMDLRERITRLRMFYWQFARHLEVSESTLTVWLREELSPTDERRKQIEEVLDKLERVNDGR